MKLFAILNEKVREAADLEVRDWVKPAADDPRQFEQAVTWVRGLFDITITIQGFAGDFHTGRGEAFLTSAYLPDRIAFIFFNSATTFSSARNNAKPRNCFELLIDFRKPNLLDFSNPASAPTPNNSNVSIASDNDTWAHAVFQKVREFTAERSNGRGFLHRSNFYDLMLLLIGLPFAFWSLFKLAPLIDHLTLGINSFVVFAAYLYVFFFAIWIYRLGFNYTKWAFPLIELNPPEGMPAKHRRNWWIIMLGVVSGVIASLII